jgi:hypothetical protein
MQERKTPSSGDCEVAAERSWAGQGLGQFGTEMAAPMTTKNPNWHGSEPLQEECEWKQGESAVCDAGDIWEGSDEKSDEPLDALERAEEWEAPQAGRRSAVAVTPAKGYPRSG